MNTIADIKFACGSPVHLHSGPLWYINDDRAAEVNTWTLRFQRNHYELAAGMVQFGTCAMAVDLMYTSLDRCLAAIRDKYAEKASLIHADLNKDSHRHCQKIEVTHHRDDAAGEWVVRLKTDEGEWSLCAANGLLEAELIVAAIEGVIEAYRGFSPCEDAFDMLYRYLNGQ